MKKIRLLEIISTVPYPIRAGGTMALFTMLDELKQYIDINIIFIIKDNRSDAIKNLQCLWPNIRFYTLIPQKMSHTIVKN